MKRVMLQTAATFGLGAWAVVSGCSGGSGSAQADGDGISIPNGGNGNSGANDNSGDDSGDAGVPDIDAGAIDDGADDGDAGTADDDGVGGASGTGGATSSAGALGSAGAGAASTATPVEPTVLVPFPEIVVNGPAHIEVDDEYVYWTSAWVGADPPMPLPTASGAYVLRIPKNGGEVSALYEASNGLSQEFAMDATHLYVSEGVDIYSTLIVKVAKDGSGAEQLATPAGLNKESHFAIDDQNLYFEGESTNGDIESVPLDGGPIVSLLSAHPLPEGYSYFPAVIGLTTDGTNLYYTGNHQGIFQVPVAGATPLRISPENLNADGATLFSHSGSWPAVKDGFVYWHYHGYIYRVPVGGGALTTVVEPTELEKGSSEPQLVIDGDYLYYFNRGLQKAALDGSSRVTLLEDAGTYWAGAALAIDDTHAYMFAASGQSIIKVPK